MIDYCGDDHFPVEITAHCQFKTFNLDLLKSAVLSGENESR